MEGSNMKRILIIIGIILFLSVVTTFISCCVIKPLMMDKYYCEISALIGVLCGYPAGILVYKLNKKGKR
jgi:hypothetical protein